MHCHGSHGNFMGFFLPAPDEQRRGFVCEAYVVVWV
jgi:hypothetical protein